MIGNKKGYTLIEVLVATAIIALVVTVATQILLLLLNSQFVLNDQLEMDNKIRQMVLRVTDELYYGFIDYDYYPSAPSDYPEILAIRRPTGEQIVYWFQDDTEGRYSLFRCQAAQNASCPIGPSVTPDPPDWQRVNDYHSQFSEGYFFVQPDTDSIGRSGPSSSDVAPFIIVHMQMQKYEQEAVDVFSSIIQTAITPRIYVR